MLRTIKKYKINRKRKQLFIRANARVCEAYGHQSCICGAKKVRLEELLNNLVNEDFYKEAE